MGRRVLFRSLRYDNNANPGAVDAVTHTVAWNTSFNSAGLRVEGGDVPRQVVERILASPLFTTVQAAHTVDASGTLRNS